MLDSSAQTSQPEASRAGYVYLLQERGTDRFKIGRANNADRRYRELAIQLPAPVDRIALIKSEDCVFLETKLHQKFAEKRLNGEWFRLNRRDVQFILNIGR